MGRGGPRVGLGGPGWVGLGWVGRLLRGGGASGSVCMHGPWHALRVCNLERCTAGVVCMLSPAYTVSNGITGACRCWSCRALDVVHGVLCTGFLALGTYPLFAFFWCWLQHRTLGLLFEAYRGLAVAMCNYVAGSGNAFIGTGWTRYR